MAGPTRGRAPIVPSRHGRPPTHAGEWPPLLLDDEPRAGVLGGNTRSGLEGEGLHTGDLGAVAQGVAGAGGPLPGLRDGLHATPGGYTSTICTTGRLPSPHLALAPPMIRELEGRTFVQGWYRDPINFCVPATFNLTNGLTIVWT